MEIDPKSDNHNQPGKDYQEKSFAEEKNSEIKPVTETSLDEKKIWTKCNFVDEFERIECFWFAQCV